jgi:hypothetical protein
VWEDNVAGWRKIVATDAQTSGGLLLAATTAAADALTAGLDSPVVRVGRLVDGSPGSIRVHSRD